MLRVPTGPAGEDSSIPCPAPGRQSGHPQVGGRGQGAAEGTAGMSVRVTPATPKWGEAFLNPIPPGDVGSPCLPALLLLPRMIFSPVPTLSPRCPLAVGCEPCESTAVEGGRWVLSPKCPFWGLLWGCRCCKPSPEGSPSSGVQGWRKWEEGGVTQCHLLLPPVTSCHPPAPGVTWYQCVARCLWWHCPHGGTLPMAALSLWWHCPVVALSS